MGRQSKGHSEPENSMGRRHVRMNRPDRDIVAVSAARALSAGMIFPLVAKV